MEFKQMTQLLQKNFNKMTTGINHLFEVDLDRDVLWELYLDSYPPGTNDVYRERRSNDCSACRQFVKQMGNVVVIKNGEVQTIWDFKTDDAEYQPVLDALSAFVKSKAVTDVFVNRLHRIGTENNFEKLENEKVLTWHHMNLAIPKQLVDTKSGSEAEVRGNYRDTRNVFKRSLDELTQDSLLTVLELISQKSLYKGEEWKPALMEFLKHKKAYDALQTTKEKELYAWEQSLMVGGSIGRIRNHSIGTLLINVSEDMELDLAVRKYEQIVAPSNYKRPKAIYTKKMLEDAKQTIQELGYMESLPRRYASLDDITVNNILFSNKDAAQRITGGDVFDEMLSGLPVNPKNFSRVEEITMEDFVNNVLPTSRELEVFLENKHNRNMVSLIAPENADAATMFKWDNGFSWAYSGNMTDSDMKANVKSAGGNVDGVLRFSIQWNDEERDENDLDAHCVEPGAFEIYFGNKGSLSPTGGMLDVDIVHPKNGVPAVENITWENKSQMKKGVYKFFVKNFSHNGGRTGFKAEIEFDGQVFNFEYDKELRQKEEVMVAEVSFDGVNFSIKEKISSQVSSRDVWGLKTNQFVPVSVMMYSPNYWDEQHGIGHKHYFFMLKDCINPENPNGFYNEFLKEDLAKHKKVFEALGGKMAVKEIEDQLSGIGFSSTQRNEVLVKVKGQSERVVKIKL